MKMLEIQVLEENMFEDDRIDFIYLEPNAIKSIERNNGLLCTIRMQNGIKNVETSPLTTYFILKLHNGFIHYCQEPD